MQLRDLCPKESWSPALTKTALIPCNCSTGISPLFYYPWETVSMHLPPLPALQMPTSWVRMLFWGNNDSEYTFLNSFCCVTVSPGQYLAREVLTQSEGCFLLPLVEEPCLPGVWLTLVHLPILFSSCFCPPSSSEADPGFKDEFQDGGLRSFLFFFSFPCNVLL